MHPPTSILLTITVVEASRTILFDVRSQIGVNFGVLAAWCVVNTALFPLACYYLRWKSMKGIRKAREAQEARDLLQRRETLEAQDRPRPQ